MTNSSSSGFVISFNMEFKNGQKASCSLDASYGDDGEHVTTQVNEHEIDLSNGCVFVDGEFDGEPVSLIILDCDSSEWDELEEWADPYSVLRYGAASFHDLYDLDLSSVKSAEQIIKGIEGMCELRESHIDDDREHVFNTSMWENKQPRPRLQLIT